MLIPSAYAQAAGGTGSVTDMFGGMAPLILQMGLLFAVFYFLMIRPQQKRAKALRDALSALKKGDQVLTSGGILGKVNKLGPEPYVELEIAPTVKIQVLRATITEVISPTSAKPAND